MLTAAQPSAHVCTPKTPKEYLDSLPAWDGVKRLDTWLPHVMDETPATAGMHRMEYLALVGRYWVLGMVNRATNPGCKFDYCPVLEGGQGFGKSTLIQALTGPNFFSDAGLDMSWGDVSQEDLEKFWTYEITELSAYAREDLQLIKTSIAALSDYTYPPYSQEVKHTPRQFLLVGTTNEDSYRRGLAYRRWLPLPVRHRLNVQWVKDHRDQLFAEARLRLHIADFTPDLSAHPGKPRFGRRGGAA
ncbi:VapE domain-containing protein [Comamonas aquatica]|uniref:Virulence-associated E family protein n=1 Tax=Comamonas aquatica TaxID=225991 RepID=A0AA42HRE3_9BURK|nr:VapE domain-containing protein [Comamonas aquatica]MDH0362813.1 virulence-associated E family protein [Comamonas aquatica]